MFFFIRQIIINFNGRKPNPKKNKSKNLLTWATAITTILASISAACVNLLSLPIEPIENESRIDNSSMPVVTDSSTNAEWHKIGVKTFDVQMTSSDTVRYLLLGSSLKTNSAGETYNAYTYAIYTR